MTNLMLKEGTIAYTLTRYRGAIEPLMTSPKQFAAVKAKILEALEDEEIKDNPATPSAKEIVFGAKNFNQLCSI